MSEVYFDSNKKPTNHIEEWSKWYNDTPFEWVPQNGRDHVVYTKKDGWMGVEEDLVKLGIESWKDILRNGGGGERWRDIVLAAKTHRE